MPDGPLHAPVGAPSRTPAAALRRVIDTELAPIVGRIDRDGLYPGQALRALGAAGLFAAHLAAHAPRPSLGAAVAAMAEVSATCMSTGFCTWCQDACAWYLEHSDNAALRALLQPGLATGTALGGTGLSNPLKALAGMEGFKLRGRRVPGGWEVSGTLPWVSNLGPGHLFGTVFENQDDPSHRIMAMVRCGDPGVAIRQSVHFIALEGTGTCSVTFRRARIDDAWLLADPLGDMIRRIRPGFVLLQTGMGLGVIQACIALMHEADRTHAHVNQWLPRRARDFEAALALLQDRIAALAATPADSDPAWLRAVLQARLEVSEWTLEAGQAALLHAGARGYVHGSPVDRRVREGQFVAIITPSIRHLRGEIAKLDGAARH